MKGYHFFSSRSNQGFPPGCFADKREDSADSRETNTEEGEEGFFKSEKVASTSGKPKENKSA